MTGTKRDNYYGIIMAGGVGSRFWPSSKASSPKQFLDILGVGETLFQTTFNRLARLIPAENIYILTNEKYVDMIKDQVPNIQDEQIVPEPEMRNTAPSILLGALKIHKKNPDALTVIAPSDHWIKEEEAFLASVQTALDSAEKNDRLLTLGIEPTTPNTGYGYIKYDKNDEAEVKKVQRFTEKPNLKKAEEFLKAGNYVWNAGIFIWRAEFIIRLFEKYLPEMYRLFEHGNSYWNTEEEKEFLAKNYPRAANISIDYGIMEKSDSVFVIPVKYHWSDLGTWSSVQSELPQDEIGNTVVNGRLIAENSENNIISTSNKKIVVLKDLSDYIIVEDENVLMIVPKSEEQEIKRIREQVMKDYGDDLG
ncbi:mannose-1-phosphate guanylyltransferase [Christiangramia sabulilitoris]|uniref:mannose-1-phosphate guanylyltransferase n=1 Tax=Christiangramia sabulilitoris TaxID=2583991 RepID=A0A550I450_9FLAO|nr:mannose-1-phosphate guanylyltransferase [Christiangramia sabulilitoris]TRO65731.1 mannose-1-phosphate guanylyltransferase [Christiangramia sabulilitoris]